MRARAKAGFKKTWAEPLARQFHQTEGADPSQLYTRPVLAHGLFEAALHLDLIARVLHVDEIDDDEAGQIAQAQLAGDLVRRFDVGFERRRLDISFTCRAPRVDVNGDQGLGGVNDDVATRLQLHIRSVHGIKLVFHLVMAEQRGIAGRPRLDPFDVARHQKLHERLGRLAGFLAVYDDLVDVAAINVADCAFDQVGFFVNHGRRRGLERQIAHTAP